MNVDASSLKYSYTRVTMTFEIEKEISMMASNALKEINRMEDFLKQEYPTAWKHWQQYRDIKMHEDMKQLLDKIKFA